MPDNIVDKIEDYTKKYSKICVDNSSFDPELFGEYGVKRGLRDQNGKGVLAGLTKISSVQSTEEIDGKSVPCDGRLYYRGYKIQDLVNGFVRDKRLGFEEITYLLLFSSLPNEEQLREFKKVLAKSMDLPKYFVL